MNSKKKLPVISLFSGAMGLDLGLEQAGFEVVLAVECDAQAIATIKRNRPTLPILERRIEDVTTREILKAAGLKRGGAFVVAGGPSCQSFSTAGQRRSLADPRGGLFRHFVRIVSEGRPKFFIMENVKGMLSAAIMHRPLNQRGPGFPALAPEEELGSAFRVIIDELRTLQYYTVFDVLNAADYGTPQYRERILFIGSRDGKQVAMPKKTHSETPSEGTLCHEMSLKVAEPRIRRRIEDNKNRYCTGSGAILCELKFFTESALPARGDSDAKLELVGECPAVGSDLPAIDLSPLAVIVSALHNFGSSTPWFASDSSSKDGLKKVTGFLCRPVIKIVEKLSPREP